MADQTSVEALGLDNHFRLVLQVRDAITEMSYENMRLLLRQYGLPTPEDNGYDSPSIGEVVQDATLDQLVGLASFLGIDIPPTALVSKPHDSDQPPPALTIDAYGELVAAETALREVVRTSIGSSWIDDFDEAKVAGLQAKLTEEDKRRDGVTVSQDLLDYTEAYHLESLIIKHWDLTQPILKDKKRTEVYLKLMLSVRNTVAHARPVVPFERQLLAGVAGQIQNLMAVHRSTSDGPDAHYASINYVRDSFGEELKSTGVEQSKIPRLKVGQTVTFECSATDPRGREIEWRFGWQGNTSAQSPHEIGTARGSNVNFEWMVSEDDVGEGCYITVNMRNSSKYHRSYANDGSVTFRYHVSPPL
ncbi:hypothetical protein HQO12_16995 [Rhodococcus fascians]|uniref:hypothetical protein n=1 Tax=Rhodococcoides fascians TaxID=1828 RepID=UPI0019611478|nr:hypothetical protein [Rhodococcus fascians]MBM7244039.1 hypothetical protein [Rhodococcus fascians]MBY3810603.1 hypothetical protein [Rhodococcus fascians]MBY3841774.1 hypothetical protein [Rhodococcus fascians]MBY3844225.1 hypothetical protein [Rhodococcus fascians]MBY3850171.1 hypothetical protein [Rhodococcus fascians]